MKQVLFRTLVFSFISILGQALHAGVAYPDPPGGWNYLYNGDQAVCGSGAFDSLDGTWNRNNGSSEWDCSPIDGVTGADFPGGVMAITNGAHASETGITYLRIQDPGNPSQFSAATNNGCGGCTIANPANRKILFVHDMTAEGCPDTALDDGFTITFRARVPTPSRTSFPLDPLYPSGESANGPVPYPADGDGILIGDNANGCLSARQLAGGKIGFSLVVSNDSTSGFVGGTKANFMGLEVNGLNGSTINNNIDFTEAPTQYLPLDPKEWNEFWIVIQKDQSGLGTHTLLVYTNGSTTAQLFHVTAASSSGEQSGVSHIEMGSSQTAQNGAVDLDFMGYKFAAVFPPGAGGAPPDITAVSPTPPPAGNLFWPVANGITFNATSSGGKTIPSSGVQLVLNGVNLSAGLAIVGGGTASISVTYSGLTANTVYSGRIVVTDSGGSTSTFPLRFDTFSTATSTVVEAEDYNHTGGQFVDNPSPNGYASFTGTSEIDFHDLTPLTLGLYRASDAVDTAVSGDTQRQNFVDAGAQDFDVGLVEQGEWLNYTRTFATGKYNVYLRYSSSVAQSVRLELVTGDRTLSNQTTEILGTFPIVSGGRNYSQLSDAFGNPLSLNLSGVTTLRLTTPEASLNLLLNYLVFSPSSAANVPPVIGYASPGSNSTTFLPDAQIKIGIVNGDALVAVPGTINLRFDGVDVTGSSTIAATSTGALITYQPASPLALNSMHTNRVIFSDNGAPAKSYTNQWTFKVANLPVLPSAWATPPGSGTNPGFNTKIHWHNEGQDLIFINNSTRAENQVGGLLIDVDTGLPYTNEAPGPNSDGTYSETNVVNYSNDATDRDRFLADQPFPNIDPGTPEHVAMSVTAHLELTAGLHRFGVRANDGFKLSAGPHFSRAGAFLPLGSFESNSTGDDGSRATEFDFVVQADGVYPFRLIFFQNSGPSDLEWYSVDRTTGLSTLINATNAGAVHAFMSRPLLTLTSQNILNAKIIGATIQFQYPTLFGYTYFVDYLDTLNGSWTLGATGFAGDGGIDTFTAPADQSTKRYYRIRAQ